MNEIEEKYGLKPGHAIALFVILVLNIISLVCNFIKYSGNVTPQFLICVFMFVAAAYYACYAYKKPHGNHMRYLLLIYAICGAGFVVFYASKQSPFIIANYLIGIILATYMAGRLDHYKQNVVICVIILICNCISTYNMLSRYIDSGNLTFVSAFASIGAVTVWLAIAGAYITRYKLHKEAGFTDK